MKNSFYFLLTVLILLPFFSFSQAQDANREIYNFFDEVVGVENIGIFNGTEYQEKYRLANKKHPYFGAQDFANGSVCYDGEIYFNLNMKYNIHEQEVILKIKNKNSSNVIIKLFKDKIKGFNIDSHQFVKVSGIDSKNDNISEFYEVAFDDPIFSLLIKYQKNKKDFYTNGVMYFEFVNAKDKYVILIDGNYIQVKSIKDIIHLFPNLKEKINNFHKDKKPLRRLNYTQFLIGLLQEIKLTKLK